MLTVKTDNSGTVRVAEDNLGTHVNKLVNKKETALKHLLMDEHAAAGLCSHNKGYTDKVGSETRPWSIGNSHDGTIHKTLNLVVFLLGDKKVVTPLPHLYAQPAEHLGDKAKMLQAHIVNSNVALRHSGHADKGTHLNHIRQQTVMASPKTIHAMNGKQIGTHALYVSSHLVEHVA